MARRALLCLTMFSMNLWAVQSIPLPSEIMNGLKNPDQSFPDVFVKREDRTTKEDVKSSHIPTTGYEMNNATSYILWEGNNHEIVSPTTPLAEHREANSLGSFGRNKLTLIDKNSQRIVDLKARSESESEIGHGSSSEEPKRDYPTVSLRVKKPKGFDSNSSADETGSEKTQEDTGSSESPSNNSSNEIQGLTIPSETEEEGGSPCPSVPATWTPYITDRELQCVVNPHWLKFDPPSHLSHLVLAAIYIVILIVGCFGNGLVIYLFAR